MTGNSTVGTKHDDTDLGKGATEGWNE